ncbi:MAG: aminotransferase class I/II-fold pyridoxal phosphate-dependent enzyme [Chloroflexia bacterium]
MDLFEKCYQFTEAKEAMSGGYYPYFLPLEDTEGTEVTIRGHRLIMIGSNNYLGLTTHPKVREAAIEAIRRYGTSCTGSRFLNGNLALIEELEARLARFMGKERALVFSTGFQTNLGTISALVGRNDYVITDKEDHASIVDGCRLSFGTVKRFRHNDMADLERILASCPEGSGKLVVVDGVFSMGGDLANLPEIVPLCKRYGARLMVDDAHSIGVLGEGRGTAAHFGLHDQVDIVMGTFSKSFASLGGFIVGDEPVIHYVQHMARSLIFSASITPPNVAAAMAALEIMETEPERRARLLSIAERMRREFRRMGYNTGNSVTPIIPIIIGDRMSTAFMWKRLYEEGIYVNPVIEPAVPPGMSLLRTSYMATHTDEQMDRVLETFERVGKEVGVIS